MAKHIFRGLGAPTFAPKQVGHHYVDQLNGIQYLAVSTGSVSGWNLVNATLGSINGLTASSINFELSVSGTSPGINTDGIDTISINIPDASVSGVTNGLISNSKYTEFDSKLFPVKNVLRVTKSPVLGLQDYSTFADALTAAALLSPSVTNPVKIIGGPGRFQFSNSLTCIPYVWIEGSEQDQTILEITDPTKHVVIGADNSGISKCLISGATNAGKAAVFYQSVSGTINTGFWVEDVRFGNNDTQVISDATNSATGLFIENCIYGGINQFNHGFLAQNGGRVVIRNTTSNGMTAPYPDYVFKATGTGSEMVINGLQCRSGGITTGAAIQLANGAKLRALSANFKGFGKAIWIENTGSASIIDAVGILCEDNTMDVQVDHPGGDGTFNGSADHTKIYVHPSSDFSVVISCNKLPSDGTGSVTVGDILQGDRNDRLANLSLLARKATTLGVLEDIDQNYIQSVSGLMVQIQAGVGFVNEPSELYLKQVSWSNTNLTLNANASNYVYVDSDSNIQFAASLPSLETVIPLGRVATRASSIIFIENSDLAMNHYSNKIEFLLRNGLGPVFRSGSIITENVTPRKLNVTAGEYFYGADILSVSGGSEISWSAYYQDGIGGFTEILSQDTVSNTQYDNGTGTLVSIPASKYVKHTLYVCGDSGNEKWLLMYGQNNYTTLAEAQDSPLPLVPQFIKDAVVRVAGVIVQQGQTNIQYVLDYRPRFGFAAPTGTAVTDHGNLTGLTDDDHPQYLLVNGTRAMTGPLNMGTQNITNVGTVDGVTVSAHASRHLPNGSDPLTTAAPGANLSATTTNATGTANSFSRSDHSHAITTGAASTQTPDQANAVGSSASLARADHIHQIPTAIASMLTPDLSNAIGVSGTFSRADHIHNIPTASAIGLDATSTNTQGSNSSFARSNHTHAIASGAPSAQTPDQSNTTGTSTNFARADHIHNIPTAAATGLSATTTNTQGSAATFTRSDHTHAISTGAASSQTPNQANATGTSANLARADHVHQIQTAAASGLNAGSTNTQGSAATFAQSDHTHAIASGAASSQTPDQVNAAGSSTNFARADHVHNIATAAAVSLTTSTTNTQGSASTFARSDHTHSVTVTSVEVTATADTTTTSATDVLMNAMQHSNPAAGTYLVMFSTSLESSSNDADVFINIYVGGSIVAASERQAVPNVSSSFGDPVGASLPAATQCIAVVNGSQNIEGRWRRSAGTATAHERTLTIVKLN